MSRVLQHSGFQKQRHLRSTQSVNSEYWLYCEKTCSFTSHQKINRKV